MTKPVTIPNTFATATTAIPLSQLDSDFSTVATALNDANTYSNYAADTGVANAYVVTLSGVSTTYSAGLRIQFKAGAANTGASTLNVNGGGTKNITFQDASALSSGTIAANAIVDVMYDGTQFLLMNDPAGATGGDVVGPAGATANAVVRFDSTTGKLVKNSVVTIADSTGDISGVGTLNATTLDATNIEVTNIKAKDGTAAASIADSTGVISVTANPVLSGGTANGVLYLNGSNVATSGSALTFDGTTFQYTGAANFATSSGNVGIGTTSPTTFSGFKTLELANSSGNAISLVTGSSVIAQTISSSANSAVYMGARSNHPLYLTTNDTIRATLDTSGNLGLGVTPSAWYVATANARTLQINNAGFYADTGNSVFISSNYLFNTSGSELFIGNGYANRFLINSGEFRWLTSTTNNSSGANQPATMTQAMTLDASGNLLVGPTTATSALTVEKGANNATNGLSLVNNNGSDGNGSAVSFYGAFGAPFAATQLLSRITGFVSDPNGTKQGILAFSTGTGGTVSERARITSGGYFKASDNGAYTGSTAAYHEFYQTANNSVLIVRATNGSYTSDVLTVNGDRATTNATYNLINAYNGAISGQFIVRDSGNAVNTNGSYGTISDAKMKTDIVDAGSQWADIKAIRFRKFKMKNDPSGLVQLGVVAQEVEQTSPGLVDEHIDRDGEGNDLGTTTKSVKTSVLLMKAAVALQEAMARIETLEAKVSALEGN